MLNTRQTPRNPNGKSVMHLVIMVLLILETKVLGGLQTTTKNVTVNREKFPS